MRKSLYILCSLVLLLAPLSLNAQKQSKAKKKASKAERVAEKKMEAAAVYIDKYKYDDAIRTYMDLIKKGKSTVTLYEKLGDAYYFKNEPYNAVRWYTELFKLKKEVEPEYYYRLSQSLKSIGKYDEANVLLKDFVSKNGSDLRAAMYGQDKNYLNTIKNNSGRYKIKVTDASTKLSDYGPAFYGDTTIVYTSNRDSIGLSETRDSWTKRSFTVLYKANITPKGNLKNPQKFSKNVETKLHESTPTFTKDLQTMYFTRNNYNEGKAQMDDKKHILLKIYKAEADGDGGWANVKELPFTSNNFNTAHPSLSSDEKTLYFASDKPGGYGGSDIYRVAINEDGTFGEPENLGPTVNTEARESFPFAVSDKLYFASDGHPGLGGLDVFVSKMDTNGMFTKSFNIGEPINSRYDDFSFIINETTKNGYFTSNRRSGRGLDDVYHLTELVEQDFACSQHLVGFVNDTKTNKELTGARVSIYDASHTLLKEVKTDQAGLYAFTVECGKTYYVKAEAANYIAKEATANIPADWGDTNVAIALAAVPPSAPLPVAKVAATDAKLKVGMDLAKEFNIEHIYFDLGKFNIKDDAAVQIDKVINFMKQYPTSKIDVRSHTDSRGSDVSNEKLSDNRAQAIVKYVIDSGISQDRITGKGYGESMLLNKCEDGVKCSENEHLANRRSEFIIIEL